MRLNKYLGSTLFTGLFITVAAMTHAQAAGQAVLEPTGNWAISKIEKEKQGGSYCTLSRKYGNGVVLSLARNETEEYSLALDFQKPTFQKDRALKINLQPGPGQLRAYDMMPTSERAVVVRLGWDEGFFNALDKSQQMKVTLGEQSYAFAMPEIARGQADLKECMDGLKAAKTGEPAKEQVATNDVLAAQPGQASAAFAAEKTADAAAATMAKAAEEPQKTSAESKGFFASLTDGFDLKGKEQDKTQVARKNFGKSSQDGDDQNAIIPASGEGVAAPDTSLMADAGKTQAPLPPPVAEEKAAAVKVKEDMPAPVAAQTPAPEKETKKPLETAKAKIEPVKAPEPVKEAKAPVMPAPAPVDAEAQKKAAAIAEQNKALEQQIANLRKEVQQRPDADELAMAQARLKEQEIKNQQLQETLRQSQTRIAETAINTETKSMQQIVDLQTRLDAAQKDSAVMAKQLESLRLKQEDGQINAVSGDWDLEQATKRYNEAEREIRRLGLELEQEKTSCNREKSNIEAMLFDPAVTERKQIERLNQLQAELDAAQKKAASNQKQIQAAVDQQLADKTKSVQAEKAALNQQLVAAQKQSADKDVTLTSLQKQLDVANAANAAQAKGVAQLADMQKTLAARDATIADLQKQATTAQMAPAEKTQMQSQIDSMKAALAQKDQQIASLQTQAPKADSVSQQQITSLQTQNQAMTQNIEAMKLALANKDKAIAEAQSVAQTASSAPKVDPAVTKQLADLQSTMAQLKKDNDILRDQNVVLRQQSDKLQLQLSDVQSSGAARADQVASAQLQADDLKRQMEMKDRQNVTYQNQLAALQQENTQLKSRLTVADGNRSSSTAEVSELTRQVQSLQRQISDLQARASQQTSAATAPVAYNNMAPAAGSYAAAATKPAIESVALAAPSVTAQGSSGYSQSSIQSLLQKAGVSAGNLQRASGGFVDADNYGWTDSNNVRGLASVRAMSGTSFQSLVDQYIAYQKGQCQGDFASMPSPSNGGAGKQISLYEVACVGGSSLSSSILFFEDQGRFIAIANQTPAADMDVAMDSRDRIANFVRGL